MFVLKGYLCEKNPSDNLWHVLSHPLPLSVNQDELSRESAITTYKTLRNFFFSSLLCVFPSKKGEPKIAGKERGIKANKYQEIVSLCRKSLRFLSFFVLTLLIISKFTVEGCKSECLEELYIFKKVYPIFCQRHLSFHTLSLQKNVCLDCVSMVIFALIYKVFLFLHFYYGKTPTTRQKNTHTHTCIPHVVAVLENPWRKKTYLGLVT